MNITQMHDRVAFYLDKQLSPRFTSSQYDTAINIATSDFIRDRVDNIKQKKRYSFDVIQRVKDELSSLVKTVTVVPTGNIVPFPSDYLYTVLLKATVDGEEQTSRAVSIIEQTSKALNSFSVSDVDYVQHTIDQNGLNVYCGGGAFTTSDLTYIKQPVDVFKGTSNISAGLLSLVIGKTYYVTALIVTHNSVTYGVGESFVAVSTVLAGAGTVINIVNSELTPSSHEEVCKIAAMYLEGSVENYNQSKFNQINVDKV